MNRLIENTVFWALVTACRLAALPTSRSPLSRNATTEGVSREPSLLVMTTGAAPSITATTELVVPRSMPMIFEETEGMRLLLDSDPLLGLQRAGPPRVRGRPEQIMCQRPPAISMRQLRNWLYAKGLLTALEHALGAGARTLPN